MFFNQKIWRTMVLEFAIRIKLILAYTELLLFNTFLCPYKKSIFARRKLQKLTPEFGKCKCSAKNKGFAQKKVSIAVTSFLLARNLKKNLLCKLIKHFLLSATKHGHWKIWQFFILDFIMKHFYIEISYSGITKWKLFKAQGL